MSNQNVTSSRRGAPPEPLAAAAEQRLRTSVYPGLREVQCESEADAVILRGRVSSFYFKQLAQEVVRHADGVRRIVNRLEVADRKQSAANGQAEGEEP